MKTISPATSFLCCAAAVGLSGCLNLKPAPDEIRNFMLTAAPGDPSDDGSGIAVGIAPVQLPAHTSTSWIAIRTGPNELHYSEAARWAEPLDENLQRVLGANLRNQPGIGAVFLNTWPEAAVQQALSVQIQTVELRKDGGIVLVAQWTRTWPQGSAMTSTQAALIERHGPRPESDMAGAVAALSDAVAELGTRITDSLLQQAQ